MTRSRSMTPNYTLQRAAGEHREPAAAAREGSPQRGRLCSPTGRGRIGPMLRDTLTKLLELPAAERVELAMALWDSLTPAEQEAEFDLTPEQRAELDRRLAEHIADPTSAIPWDEVRRKLLRGA